MVMKPNARTSHPQAARPYPFIVRLTEVASPSLSLKHCRTCPLYMAFLSDFHPFNSFSSPSLYRNTSCLHVFCLYRSSPNMKNKLTDSVFVEQFPALLELSITLKGSFLILGYFNVYFDTPSNTCTSRLIDLLDAFGLTPAVTALSREYGHALDWILHREDDVILQSTASDHSLTSDHSFIPTQLNTSSPSHRQLCVEARSNASVNLAVFKADLNSRLQLLHLSQPNNSTNCWGTCRTSTSQRHDARFHLHLGNLLLGPSFWRLNVNDAGPREGG